MESSRKKKKIERIRFNYQTKHILARSEQQPFASPNSESQKWNYFNHFFCNNFISRETAAVGSQNYHLHVRFKGMKNNFKLRALEMASGEAAPFHGSIKIPFQWMENQIWMRGTCETLSGTKIEWHLKFILVVLRSVSKC